MFHFSHAAIAATMVALAAMPFAAGGRVKLPSNTAQVALISPNGTGCSGAEVPWQVVHKLPAAELQTHVSCHCTLLEGTLSQGSDDEEPVSLPQLDKLLPLSRHLLTFAETLISRSGYITVGMAGLKLETLDAADRVEEFFVRLQELEKPISITHTTMTQSIDALESSLDRAGPQRPDLEDVIVQLQGTQDALIDCLMGSVRRAYQLALSFQKSGRPPLPCGSDLLQGIRDFALKASAESDPEADVEFALASHLSETAIAGSNVQCFGETPAMDESLGRDAQGNLVPVGIITLEDMLLHAEEESFPTERSKRANERAMRLYEHASYLSRKGGFDKAAEWRYSEAASLAATHGQPKFAAQLLARFSGYFVARGQRKEALDQADAAVALDTDEPLAQYLQASLRLTSGYYRDADAIREAALQMQRLAGLLPTVAHEAERKAWEGELSLWDVVLDVGSSWSQCMAFYDVAKFLICIAGKLVINTS